MAILTIGARYRSAVDDTEIIVVRPPEDAVDLRCGGEPMLPIDDDSARVPPSASGAGLLMGKRYVAVTAGLEFLCTKPGDCPVTVDDGPVAEKEAKPLPASD